MRPLKRLSWRTCAFVIAGELCETVPSVCPPRCLSNSQQWVLGFSFMTWNQMLPLQKKRAWYYWAWVNRVQRTGKWVDWTCYVNSEERRQYRWCSHFPQRPCLWKSHAWGMCFPKRSCTLTRTGHVRRGPLCTQAFPGLLMSLRPWRFH